MSSNTLQGLFGLVDRSARTLRRCTHASAWLPGGGNTYKRARASSVRYERRKLPRAALTSATSLPEYGQTASVFVISLSLALSFDPSAVHSRRRSDRSHSQRIKIRNTKAKASEELEKKREKKLGLVAFLGYATCLTPWLGVLPVLGNAQYLDSPFFFLFSPSLPSFSSLEALAYPGYLKRKRRTDPSSSFFLPVRYSLVYISCHSKGEKTVTREASNNQATNLTTSEEKKKIQSRKRDSKRRSIQVTTSIHNWCLFLLSPQAHVALCIPTLKDPSRCWQLPPTIPFAASLRSSRWARRNLMINALPPNHHIYNPPVHLRCNLRPLGINSLLKRHRP